MDQKDKLVLKDALEVAVRYHQKGNLNEAETIYRKVLQVEPENAVALHLLGVIALQVKRPADAIPLIKKALAINPAMGEAYNNLGTVYHALGDLDLAIANYRKAIELKSNDSESYNNLALAEGDKGLLDSAVKHYLQAITISPGYAEAHNGLGLLLLLAQSFERGWEECEWRLNRADCGLPAFPKPRWDGFPLDGKTILVHHEQGIGDTLMFMRYVPALSAYGAKKVIFKVQTPLLPLFANIDIKAEAIDTPIGEGGEGSPGESPLQYDLYVALLSIPYIFNANLSNVPSAGKYLEGDEAKVRYYKERFFDNGSFKVGIVWQGNPLHRKDRERSVPLSYFYQLSQIPGVRLYSLQKEHGQDQLQALPEGVEITNLGGTFNDFSDTAAAIENLDLVITVDTATAHLSGAMGRPTWLILPFIPDWRWFLDSESSPWYRSMRLFRQPAPGRWDDVFTRVCRELESAVPQELGSAIRAMELTCAPYVATGKGPRVLVYSSADMPNFGDRLGYHLLPLALPPECEVEFLKLRPYEFRNLKKYDLLILGTGNSLSVPIITQPNFVQFVASARKSIGIFGVEALTEFRESIDAPAMESIISSLDYWFARYRDDLSAFGRELDNVSHLGDWLVVLIPTTRWSIDAEVCVNEETLSSTGPDRFIQEVQKYRRVFSRSLHTLLCCLYSAQYAAYEEQRQSVDKGSGQGLGQGVGQIGTMLRDVFGEVYPPKQYFEIDKERAIAYKRAVAANFGFLKEKIGECLSIEPKDTSNGIKSPIKSHAVSPKSSTVLPKGSAVSPKSSAVSPKTANYTSCSDANSLKANEWAPRSEIITTILQNTLNAISKGGKDTRYTLLDIGCGDMAIEKSLKEKGLIDRFNYVAVDLFQRDDRTIVVDLNDPEFHKKLPKGNIAIFSGVLEYVNDVSSMLRKASEKVDSMILTYSVKVDGHTIGDRKQLGWLNHHSYQEMSIILQGFSNIVSVQRIFNNQVVFVVKCF